MGIRTHCHTVQAGRPGHRTMHPVRPTRWLRIGTGTTTSRSFNAHGMHMDDGHWRSTVPSMNSGRMRRRSRPDDMIDTGIRPWTRDDDVIRSMVYIVYIYM